MTDWVRTYDSSSIDYRRAFEVFLAHTDEKARIKEHLDRIIAALPTRRTLIDVGAGNGALTAWAGERFQRTIAIEPNSSLREVLAQRCPNAEIIPQGVGEVDLPPFGDLILCSHMLYYVPPVDWLPLIQRMTSWLAPGAVLVVILQSKDCDCSKVLSHFGGHCVDLVPFGHSLGSALPKELQINLERVPAQVETATLSAAYTVAEFMLNLQPLSRPAERRELEAHLQRHCAVAGRGFRLSVDQDFLTVRNAVKRAV